MALNGNSENLPRTREVTTMAQPTAIAIQNTTVVASDAALLKLARIMINVKRKRVKQHAA